MKFTRDWLFDHLETDRSLEEILEILPLLGLEVESVTDRAEALAPFTIAEVISAEQHPNADKLRVCMVNIGSGDPVQVVCGAPNARAGMRGVFAPVGAYVPGIDLVLKAGEIRGESSNGMLCSEREMELSDEHDGIIDLPTDAPVGAAFAPYAGLDDPIIEIAITPNRADCLGVRGVARDLAAAGYGTLKDVDFSAHEGAFDSPVNWAIAPEATAFCPRVTGTAFRGLANGSSPAWMAQRLRLDGDPALALDIHVVENLFGHLAFAKAPADLNQPVGNGRFAMVDMRDNRKIPDVVCRGHRGPEGLFCAASASARIYTLPGPSA